MEVFQANIAAACPLPFSGASGNLFASAVTAVVAAHCAFYDGAQWPSDYAEKVIKKPAESLSFDFIIVGAGTAGSLLANRLATRNPSQSVLLIEAGNDPGLDSEVPAFAFKNLNSKYDWHYEIEPDNNYCQGLKNKKCILSQGKGLGGSSSINIMMYVRGNARDYNNWDSYGNDGWSYNDVSPYFGKLEKEFGYDKYNFTENPWFGVMEASYTELNITKHKISSSEAVIGMGVQKVFVKNGRRMMVAKKYLNGLDNLHVMKNTLVQKVLIETAGKIATGVEIKHSSGVVMQIKGNKEVILSAGSIATPKLLMLSGIGPEKHLKEKQIKCLLDLPVGKNLQDHNLLPLFMKTNLDTIVTHQMVTQFLLQYMLTRNGPLSTLGVTEFSSFISTNKQTYPDIQLVHSYFPMKDYFGLRPLLAGYGYTEDIIQEIQKLNEKNDLLGIFPALLHPKSRGEILLADNKPTSKPIVKTNYFYNSDDVATFIKAIEFIRKLEGTTMFKALGIELTEIDIKGCEEASDYWECYIKHMAASMFHPVGTAKMGPKDDKTAVVDENLLVHGMKNLRIVDASIMPDITGSNTMGPTLMIAEKAADIIKKQYGYKDEL